MTAGQGSLRACRVGRPVPGCGAGPAGRLRFVVAELTGMWSRRWSGTTSRSEQR